MPGTLRHYRVNSPLYEVPRPSGTSERCNRAHAAIQWANERCGQRGIKVRPSPSPATRENTEPYSSLPVQPMSNGASTWSKHWASEDPDYHSLPTNLSDQTSRSLSTVTTPRQQPMQPTLSKTTSQLQSNTFVSDNGNYKSSLVGTSNSNEDPSSAFSSFRSVKSSLVHDRSSNEASTSLSNLSTTKLTSHAPMSAYKSPSLSPHAIKDAFSTSACERLTEEEREYATRLQQMKEEVMAVQQHIIRRVQKLQTSGDGEEELMKQMEEMAERMESLQEGTNGQVSIDEGKEEVVAEESDVLQSNCSPLLQDNNEEAGDATLNGVNDNGKPEDVTDRVSSSTGNEEVEEVSVESDNVVDDPVAGQIVVHEDEVDAEVACATRTSAVTAADEHEGKLEELEMRLAQTRKQNEQEISFMKSEFEILKDTAVQVRQEVSEDIQQKFEELKVSVEGAQKQKEIVSELQERIEKLPSDISNIASVNDLKVNLSEKVDEVNQKIVENEQSFDSRVEKLQLELKTVTDATAIQNDEANKILRTEVEEQIKKQSEMIMKLQDKISNIEQESTERLDAILAEQQKGSEDEYERDEEEDSPKIPDVMTMVNEAVVDVQKRMSMVQGDMENMRKEFETRLKLLKQYDETKQDTYDSELKKMKRNIITRLASVEQVTGLEVVEESTSSFEANGQEHETDSVKAGPADVEQLKGKIEDLEERITAREKEKDEIAMLKDELEKQKEDTRGLMLRYDGEIAGLREHLNSLLEHREDGEQEDVEAEEEQA